MLNKKSEAAKKRWSNPEIRERLIKSMNKPRDKIERNRFHDTKIYRLLNKNGEVIYIGSCIISLQNRLNFHLTDSHNKNNLISKYLKSNTGVKIDLIEEVKCENKEEKNIIEQKYIDEEILKKNNLLLNTNKAHFTGLKPLNKNTGYKKSAYYLKHRDEEKNRSVKYYHLMKAKKAYELYKNDNNSIYALLFFIITVDILLGKSKRYLKFKKVLDYINKKD